MDHLYLSHQLNKSEESISYHYAMNNFQLHCHDYYEIMIMTKGDAVHTFNGIDYNVKENDVWLITPQDIHGLRCSDPNNSSHLNIVISTVNFTQLCNSINISYLSQINDNSNKPLTIKLSAHDSNKIIHFISKHQSIPNSQNNASTKNSILNCLTLYILINLYISLPANSTNLPTWLETLLYHLSQKEYLEKKPSEILKTIPYSYSNFEKLFKKYMNTSFVNYLNKKKIEYAAYLLKSTDIPIITIANSIAMPSLGHFYNVFNKLTGHSPYEYRRLYGKHKK